MDYVVKQLGAALSRGEQRAKDYVNAQVHDTIARWVEREPDPAGEVARVLRVDRTTAERWVGEAGAR
ncbi:hypothetical protein [Streptomyces goshikiensis]|uniref:hypothetical protein n=1 Tax=Streptomyces goshikiensis TaxID=1942 RepID=UPI0022F3BA62|nr:hypothetical protein [Streptomyces goshikiensis]WBY24428.1 hypothetical protein PET44_32635 [Streptomyces goshikiensis]